MKKSIVNILNALGWLPLMVAVLSGLGFLLNGVFSIVVAREIWNSPKAHMEILCFSISLPILLIMQVIVHLIRRHENR
jgi:hypothetical protein